MPDIMLMGKNPNFLGAWDLYDLNPQEITVTIDRFVDEEVINNGKKEKCTVCYFKENYKPMILNLTNKKIISKLYHTTKSEKLSGKRITIYSEKVKAFGKTSDALRIKPEIPKEIINAPAPKCTVCGNDITAANNMTPEQIAAYTEKRYGKAMCASCAAKAKQEASENAE